jgi:hypothetical protein
VRTTSPPGIYCHPYDFDVDEPRWRVPDVGALSPLLWVGRGGLWRKLEILFRDGAGPTCGELATQHADAPYFTQVPARATVP